MTACEKALPMGALDGHKIIVTGAARGIGAALSRAYATEGASVALLDIREEVGRGVVADIGTGRGCFFLACDVSRSDQVRSAISAAHERLGGLDVLAAVAGLDKPGPADAISEDDWDLVFAVNAKGTFLTNQAAFHLMKGKGGSIINFGSNAGIRGMQDRAAYSAAKAAVAGWTRAAALAWGQYGVRVNTVVPIMRTEVAERYLATLDPDVRLQTEARLARSIPLGGRLGEVPQDLAPLMVFLAGSGSAFMTGQVIAVDGGMTMLGS